MDKIDQKVYDTISGIKSKITGLFSSSEAASSAQSTDLNPTAHSTNPYGSGNYGPWLDDTRPAGGKSKRGLSTYEKHTVIDSSARAANTKAALDESVQARMIVRRFVDSVVGNGLKWDPTPDFEILGISREEAKVWAIDVKKRFHLWAKSKKSDKTGVNNLYQNTNFYAWILGQGGEVFVKFNYSNDPKLTNPLQISFIDRTQIRGDEFVYSTGPETQDDGIKKGENGEESFKVWETDPKKVGSYKETTINAFDKETGLPLMIHGYRPENVGQTRGIPEISHALQDLEKITTFDASTIEKAITGASLGYTVKNMLQDPSDMGLPEMDTGGVDFGDAEPTEIPKITTGVTTVTERQIPEITQREPGTSFVLGGRQGDELSPITSHSPAESTGSYIDDKVSHLTASMSMPMSIAKMQFSKSHSASRAELGLFADVKEIKKDDIASDFLDWVTFAWLSGEIGAGRIKAPGWSAPIMKEAWLLSNWIAKPLPDVDPMKTLQAKEKAVEMGLTDLEREAGLYNGSDYGANVAKLGEQLDILPTASALKPVPPPTETDTKGEN